MSKKNSKFSIIVLTAVLLVTGLPLSYQMVSAANSAHKATKMQVAKETAKPITPTPSSKKAMPTPVKKAPIKYPISSKPTVAPVTVPTTTTSNTTSNNASTPTPTNPNAGGTSETFVPHNANFLLNPNFEDGLSNWAITGTGFSLDTNAHGNSGANSIHYAPHQSDTAHLLSEKFIVDSALHYKWSQYLDIPGTTDLNFYIDEYDANGNWISGQWKGKVIQGFTGTKSLTYIPTSNIVRFVRLQYSVTPGTTAEIYLDSVYFESTYYFD